MTAMKFSAISTFICYIVLLNLPGVFSVDKEQKLQCIGGTFHKEKPSAEVDRFSQCQPWQNFSCCTSNYTEDLASSNKSRGLYLHGWHGCGKLSQKCMDFWFAQKCFYQCSPFIYPWKNSDHGGSIKGIPICSHYCDDWFLACKDDIICFTDPLTSINSSSHRKNPCAQNPNCTTYSSTFRDGNGLCTKLWGTAYVYQKPNVDSSNCMVMWFNGSNPNAHVMKKKDTGRGVVNSLPSVWSIIAAIFIAATLKF